MKTGYSHCMCRDCFAEVVVDREVAMKAIRTGVRAGVFCADCNEAGCTAESECLCDDAYGADEIVGGV